MNHQIGPRFCLIASGSSNENKKENFILKLILSTLRYCAYPRWGKMKMFQLQISTPNHCPKKLQGLPREPQEIVLILLVCFRIILKDAGLQFCYHCRV